MRRVGVLLAVLVFATTAYLGAGTAAWAVETSVKTTCMEKHADQTPADFTATWGSTSENLVTVDATPYRFSDAKEIAIPSRSPGISLDAWWARPTAPENRAIVVVHGRDSCRHDPAVLLPAGMLHRAGFGVLMLDLRNHGTSDRESGHWAAGADEWQDVLGAFDWLRQQGVPATRIGLAGLSMGAAAVAYAVGREPAVAAAWLDSPYADFLSLTYEAKGPALAAFVPAALVMGEVIAGDPLIGDSPEREFEQHLAGRPIAIVHGTSDTTIPRSQGERLAAAAARGGTDVEPWIVKGAEHVQSAFIETAAYERRIVTFFEKNLGG